MTNPADEVRGDDWDAHWSDFSTSAARNPAQAYRFRLMRERLLRAGVKPGSRLIDAGCGTGDFLQLCEAWFPGVERSGLEMSRTGAEIARARAPGADVRQCDLLAEGCPPDFLGWATHAVCSEVLEHVDEPERLLREACRALGPGGTIVITVPGGPRTAYDRHIGHRRHFDRRRLASVMTGAGLTVDAVAAAGFPFHTLYRLMVLARGERLVSDARAAGGGVAQRLALRVFALLFRANLRASPWGWQMVAVGRVPGDR